MSSLPIKRGESGTLTITASEDISACPSVIFTAKYDESHPDSMAVFQKALGAGLSLSSPTTIVIPVVYADTKDIPRSCTLYWDVQVRFVGGRITTVASGTIVVTGDITRELDTSIPIYTTEPTAYQSAAQSAASALASKNAAEAAAATATTQAGLATTNGAAQVALAAAQVALATEQANLATAKAGEATVSATAAAGSAISASEWNQMANQARIAAQEATADAITSANLAEGAVSTAQGYAADAHASADEAAAAKDTAEAAATAAGADRVQTGLDRVATAADRATVVSNRQAVDIAMMNLTELVVPTAVAAATAAEAARDAAIAARNVTLGYRDATLTARDVTTGARDTTLTARDVTLGYRDETLTARDAAQASATTATNQANIATTQAGLATTNGAAQVALATAQVGLASGHAAAAAASATAAQNAILGQFKGGIAGNAVPATVPGGIAGDYYEITSAGTSQSIAWTVADKARWNGTSGSWTRVPGDAPIQILRPEIATRAVEPYIQFDGVTANRSINYGPYSATVNPRGWLRDAPALTLLFDLEVPTTPFPANVLIFAGCNSNPSLIFGNPGELLLRIDTSGDLILRQVGASGGDHRTATLTGFRPAYSGQRVRCRLEILNGTAIPTLTINGAAVALTGSTGVTTPIWLGGNLDTARHHIAFNWPATPAPTVIRIIGTLTAAESEVWRLLGRLPAWAQVGGRATEQIAASQNRDFSGAGTGNWSIAFGGATVANTANALDLSLPASGPAGVRLENNTILNYRGGIRTRVVFTASLLSGPATTLRCGFATGDEFIFTPTASPTTFVADVTSTVDGLFTFYAPGSTGAVVRFDDISVRYLGALGLPVVQPIPVVADGTLIGDDCARIVGGRPVTPEKRWQVVGYTNVNGNQLLLGGTILDHTRDVLDNIEQAPLSGSPTTTIGVTAGTATYKASSALTQPSYSAFTPVARRLAGGSDIWVGSNSTDIVRTILSGRRIQ